MKFEIDNDKLERVVFKYLDNKNYIIKETPDNYYFLENENDIDSKIRVKKYPQKDYIVCFVYYKLGEEIESFFSIGEDKSTRIFKKYAENKLNIQVSKVLFKNIGIYASLRIGSV